jgi:hypothetical protein
MYLTRLTTVDQCEHFNTRDGRAHLVERFSLRPFIIQIGSGSVSTTELVGFLAIREIVFGTHMSEREHLTILSTFTRLSTALPGAVGKGL